MIQLFPLLAWQLPTSVLACAHSYRSQVEKCVFRVPVASYTLVIGIMLIGVVLVFLAMQPVRPIISQWNGGSNVADTAAQALGQSAAPVAPTAAPAAPTLVPPVAFFTGVASPQGAGEQALNAYLQASSLQEDAGTGHVRFYQRDVAGGSIDLFVARLGDTTHVEVISADGATPGSDSSGDTIWTDGQRHLATVQAMVSAPNASRDGMTLLGAIAFGFHGDMRTSDEGSIVVNGTLLRSNPGRATLCLTKEHTAKIGRFSTAELGQCAQAIGGGPVILWDGKVANPDVPTPTDEFVPFNPLGEDFIQLDWRKQIYTGLYPKTAVGIGLLQDGSTYLVLATAHTVNGVDFARQLRDMGCYAALGGDDDTSTQATWRGNLVRATNPREVPDAIALYLKNP